MGMACETDTVILTYVRFARSSFSARQDSLANARTSPGFFDATEMPTASWWEALWPAPHEIVTAVGISPDMEVVDLARAMAGSPCKLLNVHTTLSQSTSSPNSLKPRGIVWPRITLRIAALSQEVRTTY